LKHLLVDITAHGYGHLAQTAPVVNALNRRLPDLRVTVRSAAPYVILKQRFHCAFQHVPVALDFGMAMINAVEVDIPKSLAAYRDYHADWDNKVARTAENMCALQPDLLFANVPYLSLAAAQRAGVPAVAMCCLNWADIYHHYANHDGESNTIHAQMLEAYNSAACFLRVQPTMPMGDLSGAPIIQPIAQIGCNRRREIHQNISASSEEKLVLIAMGGIDYQLPIAQWPHYAGLRWIVPASWQIQRDDVTALESLEIPFIDLLASCDAVITKPGYGTFAEAACSGVPVLYVSRGDWPEQPYLIEWLRQHGVCREVTTDELMRGELAESLQWLWSQSKPCIPLANGAEQAADVLEELLRAG
jgi:hypothetical protein